MNGDYIRMREILRMTKKGLKEMKVTTYTNKVHRPFWWLNHRNFVVKHSLFRAIICWWPPRNFLGIHVSENLTCWKN